MAPTWFRRTSRADLRAKFSRCPFLVRESQLASHLGECLANDCRGPYPRLFPHLRFTGLLSKGAPRTMRHNPEMDPTPYPQ
jgi:hypothetical protein